VTFINFAVSFVTFGRLHRAKAGKSEIGCGFIRKLKARERGCRTAQTADPKGANAQHSGASAKRRSFARPARERAA